MADNDTIAKLKLNYENYYLRQSIAQKKALLELKQSIYTDSLKPNYADSLNLYQPNQIYQPNQFQIGNEFTNQQPSLALNSSSNSFDSTFNLMKTLYLFEAINSNNKKEHNHRSSQKHEHTYSSSSSNSNSSVTTDTPSKTTNSNNVNNADSDNNIVPELIAGTLAQYGLTKEAQNLFNTPLRNVLNKEGKIIQNTEAILGKDNIGIVAETKNIKRFKELSNKSKNLLTKSEALELSKLESKSDVIKYNEANKLNLSVKNNANAFGKAQEAVNLNQEAFSNAQKALADAQNEQAAATEAKNLANAKLKEVEKQILDDSNNQSTRRTLRKKITDKKGNSKFYRLTKQQADALEKAKETFNQTEQAQSRAMGKTNSLKSSQSKAGTDLNGAKTSATQAKGALQRAENAIAKNDPLRKSVEARNIALKNVEDAENNLKKAKGKDAKAKAKADLKQAKQKFETKTKALEKCLTSRQGKALESSKDYEKYIKDLKKTLKNKDLPQVQNALKVELQRLKKLKSKNPKTQVLIEELQKCTDEKSINNLLKTASKKAATDTKALKSAGKDVTKLLEAEGKYFGKTGKFLKIGGKILGRAAILAAIGIETYDVVNTYQTKGKTAGNKQLVKSASGLAASIATGAIAGTCIGGPIGTVVGLAAGIGMYYIGSKGGEKLADKLFDA